MRRRSRAGGEPVKTRRHKAALKRRNAPKDVRRRGPSAAGQETEVARLTRELQESLAREGATSEVLRVISSSPSDPKPVFEAILENATRICEAKFGTMYLRDADAFRVVAMHNTPPAYAEARQRDPLVRPPPDSVLGRVSASKQVAHITDVREVQSYIERNPFMVAGVELGGYRTTLGVPMLKDGELVGIISIYRQEVRPFTNEQIELVKNFAAQAVIAIENTRLLNELRQSLQQQTATSEVLKVISSAFGDLKPVFDAILGNATRICEAAFGSMLLRDGDAYRRVALHNAPPSFEEFSKNAPLVRRGMALSVDRAIDTRQASHMVDVATEVPDEPIARFGGARTLLVVPMLKDNNAIGVLGIYRQEVRPFSDRQIELVTNFAAQAVIAIENTRLLNELRQRTDDLTELLDRQTAISEVLGVISSSPTDLQPVFQAIVESAARLCEADNASIHQVEGDLVRLVANHGQVSAFRLGELRPISAGSLSGRVLVGRETIHVADALAVAETIFPDSRSAVERQGIRTVLGVPLMRGDTALGVIVLRRMTVRPFTEKQIELVRNFAAQAVIAIENTRLLNELRELLEQQTATSEVLSVISTSPGELEPVFQAMLENATRICEATFGVLNLHENGAISDGCDAQCTIRLCRISPRPARRVSTNTGQSYRSRHTDKASVPRRRQCGRSHRQGSDARRRAICRLRANAQGRCVNRHYHHLSARSPTVHG